MILDTETIYLKILDIRDELKQDMKHLDRSSASYKFMLIYYKKLEKASDECKKELKKG